MTSSGACPAGEQLEAERSLADQQLQAVDDRGSARPRLASSGVSDSAYAGA